MLFQEPRGRRDDKEPSRLQGHWPDRTDRPGRSHGANAAYLHARRERSRHARINIVNLDCSCPPSIAQTAQAVAEAAHIVLGEAAVVLAL